MNHWAVHRWSGSAASHHHRQFPTPLEPAVWIHQINQPALVLGSRQNSGLINVAQAQLDGVEICQRRSGGGLVFIDPAQHCWIDVIVPYGSRLWVSDVSLSFHWLGATWAQAIWSLLKYEPQTKAKPDGTAIRPEVHTGSYSAGDSQGLICFDSLGPGEVTIDGRKVVGISQRRTKQGCRFQCLVAPRWSPAQYYRYLASDARTQIGTTHGFEPSAPDPTPPSLAPHQIERAFLDHLPPPG